MTVVTLRGLWPFSSTGDLTEQISRYCMLILTVLAGSHVIMTSLYFRQPITCWCPAQFLASHIRYTEHHCQTASEKHLVLPYSESDVRNEMFNEGDDVKNEMFSLPVYYLYTPLILLLLASLFCIPLMIRSDLVRCCGVIPDELVIAAAEARRLKTSEKREAAVNVLASHVHTFCKRHLHRRHISAGFRWLHGSTLTLTCLFSAVLFSINIIGQFFILEAALEMKFYSFGWYLVGRLPGFLPDSMLIDFFQTNYTLITNDTTNTEILTPFNFKRGALCTFKIRHLSSRIHDYIVQCDFPLNTLNELIYTYLWFLLFTVAVVTLTGLLVSIFRFLAYPCWRMNFCERLEDLRVLNHDNKDDMEAVRKFESEYLLRDGALLLRYLDTGAGDVVSDYILLQLWNMYKDEVSELLPLMVATRWQESVVPENPGEPLEKESLSRQPVTSTSV